MSQLFLLAFTMGVIGSFHCIGMCGPLALALPLRNNSIHAKFTGALIYNIGRVTTYSLFGLFFGIVGTTVAFFGLQQWLSLAAGSMIIIYLLVPRNQFFFNKPHNQITRLLMRLRGRLSKLFSNGNPSSLFAIGLLNGLLPCGLVYMAIAGAVAMGNVGDSILFMGVFGAGTLPAMWAIAFFGNFVSISLRKKIKSAYPYMIGLIGTLLILRGLGLGIPYISPKVEKTNIECVGSPG